MLDHRVLCSWPGGDNLHLHWSFSDLIEFTPLVNNVPVGTKPGVPCTQVFRAHCITLFPFCLLHKAKDVTGHCRGDPGPVPSSLLVVASPLNECWGLPSHTRGRGGVPGGSAALGVQSQGLVWNKGSYFLCCSMFYFQFLWAQAVSLLQPLSPCVNVSWQVMVTPSVDFGHTSSLVSCCPFIYSFVVSPPCSFCALHLCLRVLWDIALVLFSTDFLDGLNRNHRNSYLSSTSYVRAPAKAPSVPYRIRSCQWP